MPIAYIPHGHCYLWQPHLVGLHLTADFIIAIAYYSIPIGLLAFVRNRSDVPFKSVFALFSAFILACGATHLMSIWTLWHPNYWLEGLLKAITAIISGYTALTLIPIIPKALALPSLAQLEAANAQLKQEIQDRQAAEAALQESKQRLELALEASGDGLWDWDIANNKIYLSSNWLRMLGYEPSDAPVLVDSWEALLHPDEKEWVSERLTTHLQAGGSYNFDYRLQTHTGQWKWISNYGKAVEHDVQGNPLRMVGTHRDISQRKAAEAKTQESEERFRKAFDNADIGMALVAPNGQFLRVNDACCRILGYQQRELLERTIQSITHPEDSHVDWKQVRRLITEEDLTYRTEQRYLSPEGETIWVVLGVSAVRDIQGDPLYFVSQIQDDTARRLYEAQLAHQAFHDSLTTLPNRASFQQRLEEELTRAKRTEGYQFAVLFLDLDRFKSINDSLGHAAVDELLVEVASRLQETIRDIDVVARFGGDEFAVLLADVIEVKSVLSVADRMLMAFQRPFLLKGNSYTVNSSTGITLNGPPPCTPDSLLQEADIALYRAKHSGRGCYEIYDQQMGHQARGYILLKEALRQAIEQDELRVFYQPIVDIHTERILGFEALMRWQKADGDIWGPGQFMQVAEESGLILAIDWLIIEKACRQMQRWYQAGIVTNQWLSVNLSSRQFNSPDCVKQVKSILHETGLDHAYLRIEITENAIIRHPEMAAEILSELKQLGVKIALDDFGTGYSSLSYLHRFPVDTIKIDKSFVSKMAENPQSREIIRSLVLLYQALSMDTVAEGIETSE
ncbi:MAG: putative bifunctional diguanylate cyclase/phosphodiesterase [Leptolyngbyaceae cyanobacterium]